jgi:hypothetical protein
VIEPEVVTDLVIERAAQVVRREVAARHRAVMDDDAVDRVALGRVRREVRPAEEILSGLARVDVEPVRYVGRERVLRLPLGAGARAHLEPAAVVRTAHAREHELVRRVHAAVLAGIRLVELSDLRVDLRLRNVALAAAVDDVERDLDRAAVASDSIGCVLRYAVNALCTALVSSTVGTRVAHERCCTTGSLAGNERDAADGPAARIEVAMAASGMTASIRWVMGRTSSGDCDGGGQMRSGDRA